jgi:hypothetical protein
MIPENIYVHVTEQDIKNDDICPVVAAVSRCCKVPRDWVYVDSDEISILGSNGTTECIYNVPQTVAEFLADYRAGQHLNTKSIAFMSTLVEQRS